MVAKLHVPQLSSNVCRYSNKHSSLLLNSHSLILYLDLMYSQILFCVCTMCVYNGYVNTVCMCVCVCARVCVRVSGRRVPYN